jgi:putative NADH-flavin reductase
VSRSTGPDVTDPGQVAAATEGADAVLGAISARDADYTLSDVARSLLDGLRRSGTRRVLIVGGAASLRVAGGGRLLDTPDFPEGWKAEARQGAEALEIYRAVEDLDWTYVSPAASIHPGERTGSYRLGGEELITDEAGRSEISAEDYAVAAADRIESGEHARERVGSPGRGPTAGERSGSRRRARWPRPAPPAPRARPGA